ncbi:dihydrofolate reductase [Arthrobacter sp. Br18]|uniref:dihydrofolate reductase n=1 Tax=Arthrobacter sp. Br18 TaxID=1312954 RepID=UPI00047B64BF|nr:dihydrofolate reductase [Arthrobacter sp. Br18]
MSGQLNARDVVGAGPVIGMIWAQTEGGVIGRDGGIPWHVPEDLAHFKSTTSGHPVVMGRRTWESFPDRFRPLPGRTNIVVTSSDAIEGAVVVDSVDAGIDAALASTGGEEVWIIGGSMVYHAALTRANAAFVTVIEDEVEGDTFAPLLDADWNLSALTPETGWLTAENGKRYRISLWTRAS